MAKKTVGVNFAETFTDAVTVTGKAESTMTIADFFSALLHAATSAHMMHLQTKSFAVHMALDGFYKELPDLVDSLIESWQGKNGIVNQYPSGFVPQSDPVAFMTGLSTYLQANRGVAGGESELQNIIDEIAGLIDGTLYKLKNLS